LASCESSRPSQFDQLRNRCSLNLGSLMNNSRNREFCTAPDPYDRADRAEKNTLVPASSGATGEF